MSVNGITGASDTYSAYTTQTQTKNTEAKTEASAGSTKEDKTTQTPGAVYEPSKDAETVTAKKYKPDANMIAKLKADTDARVSQMKSLVEKLILKQGDTYGKANDIWSVLSSGNFTVDAATKAQAQADIGEDGYWGVSQTSQRILDFATALTGGDPSKIEKMRSAFLKGYEKAEKTWGGELPEISKQTYDAVLKGFDKMAEDAGIKTEA